MLDFLIWGIKAANRKNRMMLETAGLNPDLVIPSWIIGLAEFIGVPLAFLFGFKFGLIIFLSATLLNIAIFIPLYFIITRRLKQRLGKDWLLELMVKLCKEDSSPIRGRPYSI